MSRGQSRWEGGSQDHEVMRVLDHKIAGWKGGNITLRLEVRLFGRGGASELLTRRNG